MKYLSGTVRIHSFIRVPTGRGYKYNASTNNVMQSTQMHDFDSTQEIHSYFQSDVANLKFDIITRLHGCSLPDALSYYLLVAVKVD